MVPSVAVLTGFDCNHNKGCFLFAELTAKSCIRRTGFPLKLFPSDGCSTEQNVSEYCNTWSDVMENAIYFPNQCREVLGYFHCIHSI